VDQQRIRRQMELGSMKKGRIAGGLLAIGEGRAGRGRNIADLVSVSRCPVGITEGLLLWLGIMVEQEIWNLPWQARKSALA